MADSGDERDPLEELAEEFLDRRRRGERPAVGEYLDRHPERAEEFRELLSALVMVEGLKPEADATAAPLGRGDALRGGRSFDRLGDYRILREVGRGGMGVVYEAEHESLGRRVALKVLAPWSSPAPQQVRRFLREARSAAQLHHANIVPIFGVGEHDGLHFYTMQFIRGLGLDDVLDEVRRLRRRPPRRGRDAPEGGTPGDDSATEVARSLVGGSSETEPPSRGADEGLGPAPGPDSPRFGESPFPLPGYSDSSSNDTASRYVRAVARIGVDVASALQYAHENGMLHRDIKPSNLLLDGHGNVWVTDFGLVKAASDDDLTNTGDIVGTLRYMAPERFRGRCDARSEVYSLGLTLYELLALRPAFDDPDRHRLIHQITQSDPPPLRQLVPGLPRDVETIIQTAIAKEPAERYPTAGELAEDLRRWLGHESIRARPSSLGERAVKWARRNPTLAALVAVSALALASILTILSVGYVHVSRSLARERQTSYFQRIALAERAWSGNDVGRAEELLDGASTEFRGWEWYYLKRLCHADLLTLRVNQGREPNALAFGPDDKTLATAGRSGSVSIWDVPSGRLVRTLEGHPGGINGLAFSPNGTRVASAGRDRTIRLWEVATGRMLFSTPPRNAREALGVAFSPDGELLASCAGVFWETVDRQGRAGELTLLDATTGRPIRTLRGHTGSVHQVAFAPGGAHLASAGGDGTVKVWDPARGTIVLDLKGHSGVVMGVAYHPDGRCLASAGLDGTLRVWDSASGALLQTIREPGGDSFLAVAFSPDGRRLAAAGRNWAVTLWDATTGQRLETYRGHDREVVGLAFGRDGRRLASAGYDGLVRFWDATRGQEALVLNQFAGAVTAVALDPRGPRLATVDEAGPVRLWDCGTGGAAMKLDQAGGTLSSVAFSPDGALIAVGGRRSGILEIRDSKTGRRLRSWEGHAGGVTAVALSPDGRWLASGGEDRKVRVWDVATGRPVSLFAGASLAVTSLAFSPDGRHLAASTGDRSRIRAPGEVTIRELQTGRTLHVLRGHEGGISDLAYSPDGLSLATASWDGTVGVWDTSTGQSTHTLAIRGLLVWAVAFSPDGHRLVAADNIGRMTFWDARSGHEVLTLRGHTDRIYDLAFSADGRLLVSAGRDATAKVWDATPLDLSAHPLRFPPRAVTTVHERMLPVPSPDRRAGNP